MGTGTKNIRNFRVLPAIMISLAFLLTGCTDELNEGGTGHTTGKVVMVSLKVSIPPVAEPKPANGSAVNGLTRNGGGSEQAFTVALEGEEKCPVPTRGSGGTTKLYNLWLFQFNEDGSINGNPHPISDGVTAVNDMVTIDVPLVVAENQTLYLLALGPKLNADLGKVNSLSKLEEWSFEYLTNAGGRTESLITADDEVPFAGKVSGATVVDIDDGNRGLVEYNKPSGFVGGIEIRRLMARITLRYKFDVEDYKLQGLKLLNVNSMIRLTNPETNPDTDTYAVFEVDKFSSPDANGFYTATWYVAQNCQGTVENILSEDKRYHKVVNGTASGDAPALGTQIEAWAYSTAKPNEYAIYQMYIGNNNINNFDVEPNHFYNLRTTINAEINSAKNDERIRAYTATQYVEFHASKNISVSGGASFDRFGYNKDGDGYDLDAVYEVRPIVVQTQGRTVEVGIYADEGCTQQVLPTLSWLRLSSSSNYTEAYNNVKEPLDTHLSANTILPTQVKFYLYNEEYIYDEDGNHPDPGEDTQGGKRSLYMKVTTTINGDDGALQASHIFRVDQRPAIYIGRFGGERDENGNYKMGLVETRLTSRPSSGWLVGVKSGSIRAGYNRVKTALLGYGTDNTDNGQTATRHLAENTYNQYFEDYYTPITIPQKNASGQVFLYQYQDISTNTFAARVCYDRNRDENGNGIIDGEELKWYLPASNQLLGICAGGLSEQTGGTSTTEYLTNYTYFMGVTNSNGFDYLDRTDNKNGGRCVKNVPLLSDAPY